MVLLDATCMLLIAIGESLKNLDKTTDGLLLPTYPSIPWKNVKGPAFGDMTFPGRDEYLKK